VTAACGPWTASWRAQRRHCSHEAQGKAIDVGLTVVAAESSLTYSGVTGPVTRVFQATKVARHGRETRRDGRDGRFRMTRAFET
jgi:hypothetical protein